MPATAVVGPSIGPGSGSGNANSSDSEPLSATAVATAQDASAEEANLMAQLDADADSFVSGLAGELPDCITAEDIQFLANVLQETIPLYIKEKADHIWTEAGNIRDQAVQLRLKLSQERASPLALLGAPGAGKSTTANQVRAQCKVVLKFHMECSQP